MRLLIGSLGVLIILAVAAPAPSFGLSIVPGTYKLEWKIPEPQEPETGMLFTYLQPMSSTQAGRYEGLSSAKCLSGTAGPLIVIIDESKGTGNGYDTAYFAPAALTDPKSDLKQAGSVTLKVDPSGTGYDPDLKEPLAVSFPIGPAGSRIVQKAAISPVFRIYLPDKEGKRTGFANLWVRGGWYGKIKTDEGELEIGTLDRNWNGRYDDRIMPKSSSPYLVPGDAIRIRKAGGPDSTLSLGKAVGYGGKLYSVKVSETGDALQIQPYEGDTAELRIDSRDSRGKPVPCAWASVGGPSGTFLLDNTNEITVPPGKYWCWRVFLVPKQEGPEKDRFGVAITSNDSRAVARNQTAVFKYGGPIKVEIQPGSDVVRMKHGEEKSISLAITVGGNEIGGVSGNREPKIEIRDTKGKVLKTDKGAFG